MGVREVRMVRFRRCGSRFAKSNAIKVHRHGRSQQQALVYVPPVRVFRLQLGGRGHFLRHLRVPVFGYRVDVCVFLWSGVAASALLTVGYCPLDLCLTSMHTITTCYRPSTDLW
jgi:hypothetical protein